MALDFVDLLPRAKIQNLVILCHGYGADKHNLMPVASQMAEAIPGTAFVSPDGLFPCEQGEGRQWFSLFSTERQDILKGLKVAHAHFNVFFRQQRDRFSLSENNIVLLGFSQGVMLSLYTALRQAKTLAGVVGYSGCFVDENTLEGKISTRPPVLLIHGEQDSVISPEQFRRSGGALRARGCPVEMCLYASLGHNIDSRGLKKGAEFLQKCLGLLPKMS